MKNIYLFSGHDIFTLQIKQNFVNGNFEQDLLRWTKYLKADMD